MSIALIMPHRLFAFALCAGFAPAQVPEPKDFEAALARYQQCIVRPPFQYQTEARETLAKWPTAAGLQQLIADYGKKGPYPEYTRYTLATLFGRYFDKPEFLPALDALRLANSKPVDTWLWVKVLSMMANRDREQEVLQIACEDKVVLHRAAAIVALGESRRGDCDTAIKTNCIEFPKKEGDRFALLGAMSSAIEANRRRVNDERFREALTAYISLLSDDVKLSEPGKLQIARQLQEVLKGPALFVDPEPWLTLLKSGDVKTAKDSHTVTGERFFGIESEGERICYVLDLSDSMCKPISPELRPKGPVTGPRKKPKGAMPDESDLPWAQIHNRFDLAREQLRISLQRLSKDKYFSIVVFGDKAETLSACKGMVRASKGNIDRAMAELDAKKPGAAIALKAPDGTLNGRTNLHAGLQLAFGLCDKVEDDAAAYVDAATLSDGCDTIFLLSDGAPSIDDFYVLDRDYGEGKVVLDQEYGAEAPRSAQIWYPGPYVLPQWLVDDVTRMNLLRRVRVHCIAIGEADQGLLRQLSSACYGQLFVVGAR